MNPEGSTWQCRVFPAHPTRCYAERRPFPSRLFNLFFGLRGDGDAASGPDRCLPSAAHAMGFKGSNEKTGPTCKKAPRAPTPAAINAKGNTMAIKYSTPPSAKCFKPSLKSTS